MTQEELVIAVKELIIETCELEDISVDDIDAEASLFNEGLGLDSIDALEIGVALQKKYSINLETEFVDTKKYFASVMALVELIETQDK